MLLRSALAILLFLQLVSFTDAATVKGVLTGRVTSLYASNLAGNNDTAAFASILPFAVGSTVQTEFTYDTATFQDQFTHNVTGTVRLSIDGNVFFEQATTLDVTPDDSVTVNRNRFILTPGSPVLTDLDTLFPSGWQVDQTFSDGGSSYAFRAVGLFGATDLPIQGLGVPIGPWDGSDFSSTDFWIMTSVTEGGSSTWTVPGAGSYTGREQGIFGTYTSFTVSVVPEPSSILLVSTGFFGLTWRLRGICSRAA